MKRDALTQWSSHYNLALVKVTPVFALAHFSCLLPNTSHHMTGAIVMRTSMLFIQLPVVLMADQCMFYMYASKNTKIF